MSIVPHLQEIDLDDAFAIGEMDASDAWPFAPELYFSRRPQMMAYALAFHEVQPDNIACNCFLFDAAYEDAASAELEYPWNRR